MNKVGVLSGYGFTPTNEDCKAAYKQGLLPNVDEARAVSLTGDYRKMEETKACLHLVKQQDWRQPLQMNLKEFIGKSGGKIWALWS